MKKITQYKFFQNPSLILLEQLMNDWTVSVKDTVSVLTTSEVMNVPTPTFMIEYEINEKDVIKPKNSFQLVTEINQQKGN